MKCLGCGGECRMTASCGPMWDYKCGRCGAKNERLQRIDGSYCLRASHTNGWSTKWRAE